jgi:hypothetical protein
MNPCCQLVLLTSALSAWAGCSASEHAGASGGEPDAHDDAPSDGSIDAADAGPSETGVDSSGCVPASCVGIGAECGSAPDGCGGVIDCGECLAGTECGGGGVNVCGTSPCVPKTCVSLGAACGIASDGCGATVDCGTCVAPETCGGSGVANQCGCVCERDHASTSCSQAGCVLVGCDVGFGARLGVGAPSRYGL